MRRLENYFFISFIVGMEKEGKEGGERFGFGVVLVIL